MCDCVFFFKQKTAYEMRISDWSSDVCSSDLRGYVCKSSLNQWRARIYNPWILALWKRWHPWREFFARLPLNAIQLSIDQCAASSSMGTRSSSTKLKYARPQIMPYKIGRTSCRERVFQYV